MRGQVYTAVPLDEGVLPLPIGTHEWPVAFQSPLPEIGSAYAQTQGGHTVAIAYNVELIVEQVPGHIGFIPLPNESACAAAFSVRPVRALASRLDYFILPHTHEVGVPVNLVFCFPNGAIDGSVTSDRCVFDLRDGPAMVGLLELNITNNGSKHIRECAVYLRMHLDTYIIRSFDLMAGALFGSANPGQPLLGGNNGMAYQSRLHLGKFAVPGSQIPVKGRLDCATALFIPPEALVCDGNFLGTLVEGKLNRIWFEIVVEFRYGCGMWSERRGFSSFLLLLPFAAYFCHKLKNERAPDGALSRYDWHELVLSSPETSFEAVVVHGIEGDLATTAATASTASPMAAGGSASSGSYAAVVAEDENTATAGYDAGTDTTTTKPMTTSTTATGAVFGSS